MDVLLYDERIPIDRAVFVELLEKSVLSGRANRCPSMEGNGRHTQDVLG